MRKDLNMPMTDERLHMLTSFEGQHGNVHNRINFSARPTNEEIIELAESWGFRSALSDVNLLNSLIERSSRHCGELADEAVRKFMRYIAIDKNGNWVWLGNIHPKAKYPKISIQGTKIYMKVAQRTNSKFTGDVAYVLSYIIFNGQLKEGQEVHHINRFRSDRLHPDNLMAMNSDDHKEFEQTCGKIGIDFAVELKRLANKHPNVCNELKNVAQILKSDSVAKKMLILCTKYAEIYQNSSANEN